MEEIKEITECCICHEAFTDPRMLPCIHTFCLKCLQQIQAKLKEKEGGSIPCPLCRKQFTIPEGGMADVQKNFFMERLTGIKKLSTPMNDKPICEKCLEDHDDDDEDDDDGEKESTEIPPAVMYCIQCHKNICKRCSRDYKRYDDLKKHQLVQIGSQLKDEFIQKLAANYCDQHVKKEYDMYCIDCKKVICVMCFAESHQMHKCSDIEKMKLEFHKQIVIDAGKMEDLLTEVKAKADHLVKEKANIVTRVANAKRKISNRGQILKELVDKQMQSLLDDLQSKEQEILKEMNTETEENDRHKVMIETFKNYCTELNGKGSAAEVCGGANELHCQAVELEEMYKTQRHLSHHIFFERSSWEDSFKETENMLGKLRNVSENLRKIQPVKTEEDDKSEVFLMKSLDLPLDSFVNGVTKLDDSIYVLCRSPNSIRVFEDQNPFNFQKAIEIKEIQCPVDIASCNKSKCLFVSDKENKCIWKMSANDYRVTKWVSDVDNLVSPYTLSVSSEGHLLILKADKPSSQLEIYDTADASLIRSVTLTNIIQPQHAIERSDGQIVVIHQMVQQPGHTGQWVISVLNANGYGPTYHYIPRNASQNLESSFHMAVSNFKPKLGNKAQQQVYHGNQGQNDPFIYVADSQDHKVILFSLIAYRNGINLLTKEGNGIVSPYRLYCDEEKGQLIVGEIDGKVHVYRIN